VFRDVLLRQPSDRLKGLFPAETGRERMYHPTPVTRMRVDDRREGDQLERRVPDWMGSEKTDYAVSEYFGVIGELQETPSCSRTPCQYST